MSGSEMARARWSQAPDDDAATMYVAAMERLEAAGLDVMGQQTFPPGPDGKIAVSLWLARDPRIVLAAPAAREVA